MARERRTKQQIIEDVTFVLNSEMHRDTKRAVVKNAAWAWTSFSGKYKGCPDWTEAAHERYKQAEQGRKRKGLNHEHAVPIKVFFDMLVALPSPIQPETVERLFEKFMRGVVVTKEQHADLNKKFKNCMPSEFSAATSDPLIRYAHCGLEVITVEWSD